MPTRPGAPAVRFRGFTDAWERRELGEFFSESGEKNSDLRYGVEKTISVSTMTWNPKGNGAAVESLPNYKVLHYGDLAFEGNRTKGHPYGKLVINDIGSGIMSSRFRVLGQKKTVCVPFWKYYLSNDAHMKDVYIRCTKRGTLMTELVSSELLKQEIQLPNSTDEQEKVGELMAHLDKLITLHQRKCDCLRQYRKAFLAGVFPKDESGTPSLAVSGTTRLWKRRKLGDVIQVLPFQPYLAEPEDRGPYPVIQQGGAPVAGYADGSPFLNHENVVLFGDHALSIHRPTSPFFVATDGVRILKGADDMSGDFLAALLERNLPKNEGYKRYLDILKNQDCWVVDDAACQAAIGAQLKSQSDLLRLHSRQVELLTNAKRALLDKMFV